MVRISTVSAHLHFAECSSWIPADILLTRSINSPPPFLSTLVGMVAELGAGDQVVGRVGKELGDDSMQAFVKTTNGDTVNIDAQRIFAPSRF